MSQDDAPLDPTVLYDMVSITSKHAQAEYVKHDDIEPTVLYDVNNTDQADDMEPTVIYASMPSPQHDPLSVDMDMSYSQVDIVPEPLEQVQPVPKTSPAPVQKEPLPAPVVSHSRVPSHSFVNLQPDKLVQRTKLAKQRSQEATNMLQGLADATESAVEARREIEGSLQLRRSPSKKKLKILPKTSKPAQGLLSRLNQNTHRLQLPRSLGLPPVVAHGLHWTGFGSTLPLGRPGSSTPLALLVVHAAPARLGQESFMASADSLRLELRVPTTFLGSGAAHVLAQGIMGHSLVPEYSYGLLGVGNTFSWAALSPSESSTGSEAVASASITIQRRNLKQAVAQIFPAIQNVRTVFGSLEALLLGAEECQVAVCCGSPPTVPSIFGAPPAVESVPQPGEADPGEGDDAHTTPCASTLDQLRLEVSFKQESSRITRHISGLYLDKPDIQDR